MLNYVLSISSKQQTYLLVESDEYAIFKNSPKRAE